LIADEIRQGALKILRIKGWPLSRKIQLIIRKESFASKAMHQFLRLVVKRVPETRLLEAAEFVFPASG
jgi:hypothetical protein